MRKFLFDKSFDTRHTVAPSRLLSQFSYSAPEVEIIWADANAAGFAAGVAEARASTEAHIADALASLIDGLKSLIAEVTAHESMRTRELVGALGMIAKKLIPSLIERHGLAEIETLLRDCLSRLHDEPRIVVRVADATLDTLRPRLDGLASSIGFAGRIIAIGDPAIQAGDAKIEWADGGAERDSARAWADIDGHIARFLETWPQGRAS